MRYWKLNTVSINSDKVDKPEAYKIKDFLEEN